MQFWNLLLIVQIYYQYILYFFFKKKLTSFFYSLGIKTMTCELGASLHYCFDLPG